MNLFKKIKNEKVREYAYAIWLCILLYIVLAFADFKTGFQYAGF